MSTLLVGARRRERLTASSAEAVRGEQAAQAAAERAALAVGDADSARDAAEAQLRASARELDEAAEAVRRLERQAQLRREAPAEGAPAVRQAELTAELRAERRLAEQIERERAERRSRAELLRSAIERQVQVAAAAERVALALELAEAAVAERRERLAAELAADEELGEGTAAELRACAQEEAGLQERLRKASEAVTVAEVRAQQVRDRAAEHRGELERLAQRLGFEAAAAEEPLDEAARSDLSARQAIQGRVQLRRGHTVYDRTGDWPVVAIALLALAGGARPWRRASQAARSQAAAS